MMKIFLFFIFSISLFAQQKSLIKYLSGEIKIGYMKYYKEENALAGKIHLETKDYNGLCLGTTIEGVLSNNSGEFGGEKREFATFSELFAKYKTPNSVTKAGRIMVEWTPHADSDDIRMMPNYFEGVNLQIDTKRAFFHLLYLTKMAGWESGGDISKFKSLNEVLGIEEKIDALAAIGFVSGGWNLWGYFITDTAIDFYTSYEWIYNSWTIGVQFDIAKDIGNSLAGDIKSRTFGIYLQKDFNLFSLYAAANKEFGDGAMFSFGGGPFYTSLEILTIDSFGKDAKSYVIGLEKEIFHTTFGVASGWFSANTTQKEMDIYITRTLTSGLSFDILYSMVQEDENLFRAIIKYGF